MMSKDHIKYQSILFAVVLTVFCSGALFSQTISESNIDYTRNKPYINPTPGEITIMALTPIPPTQEPTRADFEQVVDCGFNLVSQSETINNYKKQFELMKGLNLKYLVSNIVFSKGKADNFVKELRNYPQLGGWSFKDEPHYNDLDTLRKNYELLYSQDSSNFIIMNLIGGVNKIFTGPFTTYPAYLNYIQSMFAPQVWSYDYYPIFVNKGKITVVYGQFYNNLEAMYDMSKKTNRPFWAFCQSMAFKTKDLERPAAKEEYLRFEAFSALAYGAQGIGYWTYAQRESTPSETYYSALVDLNGKKTQAWYGAQKVNNEIKKFNNVFLECNVVDVRHTGNINYSSTRKLNGKFGPFNSVKSGNAGLVVSHIKNKGKEYVMIVSRDVMATQKFTLTLSPGKRVKDLTTDRTFSGGNISDTLDKGGYRIYEVL